ncbi:NUDIX domain-containing protein [Okeania sp.]|uniref:NUDIX domain-containing protein n=1 Tax=Okeania sp. TaxID=3100323 RepID=UPI002B4B21DB|nr:NUDIX domain-containing protein [Okeania sp.]MEB3340101.1 NUDIX domain-containing protein [Okeania sp.]
MQSEVRLKVAVLGLFVADDQVLLLHQMTDPEPNCWDLPGGGLKPQETLMEGLAREIKEETGITDFQVERLLTISDKFFPESQGKLLHALNIIYQCTVEPKPTNLSSDDPEVGPLGIKWIAIATLTPEKCSSRTWEALQAAGLIT